MNWEAIGSIGETLGALAVLATLVYLSLQVRHGKEQGERTTLHHVADGFRDFTSRIAESAELASIYRRGRTAKPMFPELTRTMDRVLEEAEL